MQRFATVFAILVVSACGVDLIGRTQWSAVTGTLMCNGAPASGVQVKLMESDNSFLPGFLDTDDKMASGKADAAGEFSLSGSTAEITDIEPYLAVFHDCSDGIKPCQRVYRVNIPTAYTNTGGAASKIYNAGVIELAGSHPDESRDCIH